MASADITIKIDGLEDFERICKAHIAALEKFIAVAEAMNLVPPQDFFFSQGYGRACEDESGCAEPAHIRRVIVLPERREIYLCAMHAAQHPTALVVSKL